MTADSTLRSRPTDGNGAAGPAGNVSWFGEIRTRNLGVRLAASPDDLAAVQELRYRVFYEELDARPSAEMRRLKRDFDRFDTVCDHLIVVDHDSGGLVVGNYRLLRGTAAKQYGAWYTAGEYDISPLERFAGEKLELGRSCVAAEHRNRPTMQLLWRGIARYVFHWDITLLFGCGSLQGTDPHALAQPLSFLYHRHLAPADIRPRAVASRFVAMDILPRDRVDDRIDLPPLIKGYLRLGGFVGDGAVVDPQFNTTDVCIVVPTGQVTDRYYKHYERSRAGRAPRLAGRPG